MVGLRRLITMQLAVEAAAAGAESERVESRSTASKSSTSSSTTTDSVVLLAVLGLFVGVGIGTSAGAPLFLADLAVGLACMVRLVERRSISESPARPFASRFPRGSIQWWVAALVTTWLAALAIHPTTVGAISTARFLALGITVPALIRSIQTRPARTGRLLAMAACAEATVVLAQSFLGHRIGLGALEAPEPFRSYGSHALAPLGTIHQADLHGWFLASIGSLVALLVTRRRLATGWGVVTLALGVASAVVSYRRVAIVAWGGVGAWLLLTAVFRRSQRRRAGALALAMVFSGLILAPKTWPGWIQRATTSTADGRSTSIDSGRSDLLPQAVELFKNAPLTGVGPIRYYEALKHRYPTLRNPTVVHVVPVLLIVDGGIFVGISLVGLAVALGRRLRRRRLGVAANLALFGIGSPLIALSMLTPLPVMYAIGPLLVALNVATLVVAAMSESRATDQ